MLRRRSVLAWAAVLAVVLVPAVEATDYPGWRHPPVPPSSESQSSTSGTTDPLTGEPAVPANETPQQTSERHEAEFLGKTTDAMTFFLILMIGAAGWLHLICDCD